MADQPPKNAPIPVWRFCLRLVWVVIQLTLVYSLGQSGAYFVYQGF
jgi:hypothetical protein